MKQGNHADQSARVFGAFRTSALILGCLQLGVGSIGQRNTLIL